MTPFEEAEIAFQEGLEAKERRDYRAAETAFRRAVDRCPSHAAAHQHLGALLFAWGDLQEARKLLTSALDMDPENANAHLYLALVHGRLSDHPLAVTHFERAIQFSDMPAVDWAVYGNYLAEERRTSEAESAFRQALSLDPECVLALRDYARLRASLGRDEDAEALFRRAIRINPQDAHSHWRFGRFLSCFPARRDEAGRSLRKALELDPGLKEAQGDLDEITGG